MNEVEQEEKAASSVVSAENKAAQALDKVFTQDQEQMETETEADKESEKWSIIRNAFAFCIEIP